jgi:hypothetical protein
MGTAIRSGEGDRVDETLRSCLLNKRLVIILVVVVLLLEGISSLKKKVEDSPSLETCVGNGGLDGVALAATPGQVCVLECLWGVCGMCGECVVGTLTQIHPQTHPKRNFCVLGLLG